MTRGWLLLALALVGCEQNIGTTGTDRPSLIAACAEAPKGLRSEPQPVHRDRDRVQPVVVNIPPPEPSIRCSRDDHVGGAGATTE